MLCTWNVEYTYVLYTIHGNSVTYDLCVSMCCGIIATVTPLMVKMFGVMTQTPTDKPSNSPTLCTFCEEVITESSNNAPGEDSIFCDGTCKSWIHRRCGGLSAAQVKVVSSSSEPFLCPNAN